MKRADKIRLAITVGGTVGTAAIAARHIYKFANEEPNSGDPEKENLRRAAKGIFDTVIGKPRMEPIKDSVYGPREPKRSCFRLSMAMHRDDDPLPTKDDGTIVCPPGAAGLPFDW